MWASLLAAMAGGNSVTPAVANPTLDGWGYGIADPSDPNRLNAALGVPFARLGAKTFRTIVPWNAANCPWLRDHFRQRANHVKARGVQEIVVTFGKANTDCAPNTATAPDSATWANAVGRFISEFDSDVRAWSPWNEPNHPESGLADVHGAGPEKLAGYYAALRSLLPPGDLILSPELLDRTDSHGNLVYTLEHYHSNGVPPFPFASQVKHYLHHYRHFAAQRLGPGAGFGHYAAFHPYGGVLKRNPASTNDFISSLPSGKQVWITEVGAQVEIDGNPTGVPQWQQMDFLIQLVEDTLAIQRVYYWHMRAIDAERWDSALLDDEGNLRDIWDDWCAQAHGRNAQDAQCGGPMDDLYVAASCNGAGPATIGVFRRSTGVWMLRNSNAGGNPDLQVSYGGPWSPYLDVPVACDWDGNGTSTVGVFRRSTGEWLLRNSNSGGPPHITFQYGGPWAPYRDIPVVGDWDGNGTVTVGVFRRSTGEWLLRNSNSGGPPHITFQYGGPWAPYDDVPVVGDWDRNGTTTVGVFRRSTGQWLLRNSNTAGSPHLTFQYGGPKEPYGDVPVVGDWNGDGTTTVGVFRRWTGEWLLKNSNGAGLPDVTVGFGAAWTPFEDVPVVGDWNGVP